MPRIEYEAPSVANARVAIDYLHSGEAKSTEMVAARDESCPGAA